MERFWISRRRMLASAVGVGLGLAAPAMAPAEAPKPSPEEPFPKDAKEAQRRLIAGNKRFVVGDSIHPRATKEWRQRLTRTQKPFAAVLGCSDSRVPAELIFDQGFGDLFVVRNAGNVVATDVLGSLEYADVHLKVPLLLVLGHEGCGAVTAALAAKFHQAKEPERIESVLEMIVPGLKDVDPKLPPDARLAAAVEANVRWSMSQLAALPEAKEALKDKRFEMVGAVYDLETGAVRFLS